MKYKYMLLHLQFWCALRMTHLKEQCICIKFCFELGKCYGNFEMFEVSFAEQTLESTQVSDWFSKFKSGVTSMEDAENLGHSVARRRFSGLPGPFGQGGHADSFSVACMWHRTSKDITDLLLLHLVWLEDACLSKKIKSHW